MTLIVSKTTLDEARSFFEERGSSGLEGTAMIASNVTGTKLVIPEQQAGPFPRCWVEVPERASRNLPWLLAPMTATLPASTATRALRSIARPTTTIPRSPTRAPCLLLPPSSA